MELNTLQDIDKLVQLSIAKEDPSLITENVDEIIAVFHCEFSKVLNHISWFTAPFMMALLRKYLVAISTEFPGSISIAKEIESKMDVFVCESASSLDDILSMTQQVNEVCWETGEYNNACCCEFCRHNDECDNCPDD